jgi:hypothetical protein
MILSHTRQVSGTLGRDWADIIIKSQGNINWLFSKRGLLYMNLGCSTLTCMGRSAGHVGVASLEMYLSYSVAEEKAIDYKSWI